MSKIIEKIKNFFCGKSKCQPENKQATPPQEEAKKEVKLEEQK